MRALKVIAALITAALTVLLGWLWSTRRALPYGEEGRYFDEASSVTYDDGAVTLLAAAALLCGLATILLAVWAWRR